MDTMHPATSPDDLVRSLDLPKYCATRGAIVSFDRIRQLIRDGRFPEPALVLGPRSRYWRAGDVDAFLLGGARPSPSATGQEG